MTDDHQLVVFDEPPVIGRDANRRAWRGYLESFPAYTIHPHRVATRHGGQVTVLGHTTGSHLGLPEEEESQLTLLWIAEIAEGLIRSWTLVEDTHASRRNLGLADDP
jgi:SnoaL-like domain